MKPELRFLTMGLWVVLTLLPWVGHGQTHMGTYNLLIVPVDFSDDTGTFDARAFDEEWLTPLLAFFDHMSTGHLSIKPTTLDAAIRLGERRYYHDCSLGASCRDLWSSPGNPLETALANGDIEATSDGLVPPGGGSADVFDGILFLTAQGVNAGFPGWATGYHRPSVDISSRGYPMGHAPMDENGNGTFEPTEFGVAAHELGHMLGGWTHPAGYISAYELMDSCYPCALGIFTRVDRSALTGSFVQWFSGWLPADKLAVCEPPTGGTVVLAPIEISPGQTTAPQGLQVLTGANYSYIVECRRFIPPDDIIPLSSDRPMAREGALILKAVPGADPETQLMLAPGYTPTHRWESSFITGESFSDSARSLSIGVGPSVGEGLTITVTYGEGALSPVPDVGLIPWLTPPMNTYETIDIWVDSPANGFERDDPGDPRRLRYGRREDAERTVIGNGDDPCANEDNLVYARIRNLGTDYANDVVVHFEVTTPLGVGIRDATGWTRFATAKAPEFPELASIPPGEYVDVYGVWHPEVPFPAGTERLAFHSCLRVVVDAVSGELVLSNQDGDGEQENVGWFEMPRETLAAPYDPIDESIFLVNDKNWPREYYLSVVSNLPEGWRLDLGSESLHYLLGPGDREDIPVRIEAPADAPVGGSYFVDVRAYEKVRTTRPNGTTAYDSVEVAGVVLAAQTVMKTTLVISATLDTDPARTIKVNGKLTPPVCGGIVAVRYQPPEGSTILHTAVLSCDGKFTDEFKQPFNGTWKIRGLWQGDLDHASALSNQVYLNIGASTPPGCAPSGISAGGATGSDMLGNAVVLVVLASCLLVLGWRMRPRLE